MTDYVDTGLSKSSLAIILSRLKALDAPDPNMEQFATDSEIAADILWKSVMLHDIQDKAIADLGCGTGVLSIGAALLGARKIVSVDLDEKSLAVFRKNLEELEKDYSISEKIVMIKDNLLEFDKGEEEFDTIIMNPPFGTKTAHTDKLFLIKAFDMADVVYSLHKTSTREFIMDFADRNGFKTTYEFNYSFPIKNIMPYHQKRIQRIDVTFFRFERKKSYARNDDD